MDYLLLIISIPIMFISIRGVIRGYNDQNSFKKHQIYITDVLGMVCGIGLFLLAILRLIGFDIK